MNESALETPREGWLMAAPQRPEHSVSPDRLQRVLMLTRCSVRALTAPIPTPGTCARLALLYGRSFVDTLHERVGEEEDVHSHTDLHRDASYAGGWVRALGVHGQQDSSRLGSVDGSPHYNYNFFGCRADRICCAVNRPTAAATLSV
jgi:hypothetical protein